MHELRPFAGNRRERAEPALRMIQRAGAAQAPQFSWENQPLHFVAMPPPLVPKCAQVNARVAFVDGQVGRCQKTGDSKKERLRDIFMRAQDGDREALRQQGKGQFVLLVTKRRGQLLEERFISSVILRHRPETRRTCGCSTSHDASWRALAQCRAMRTASVLMPRSTSHESKGPATAPIAFWWKATCSATASSASTIAPPTTSE